MFWLESLALSGKETFETYFSTMLVVLWGHGGKRAGNINFWEERWIFLSLQFKSSYMDLSKLPAGREPTWKTAQFIHCWKRSLLSPDMTTTAEVSIRAMWLSAKFSRELMSQHSSLQQTATFWVPNWQWCSIQKLLIMDSELYWNRFLALNVAHLTKKLLTTVSAWHSK